MLSSSSPNFSPRWLCQFFLISLFTVLTACGGGGGSSSDTGGSSSSSSGGGGGSSSGGANVDRKADAFSFTAVTDAEPGETYVSNTVTIRGIDVAVPVSVTGGEYSLSDGSGEFTAEPGQVGNDQPLTLRVDAPAQTESSAEVTVTVGEGADAVTATYTVTTLKDTTGPEASIVFPPPMSATDQERIVIRGTAVDDYHSVTDVKLHIDGGPATPIEVQTETEFSVWTAEVLLNKDTEHTITVTTTDSEGNITESAAQVVVQRQLFDAEFPAGEQVQIQSAWGLAFDAARDRIVILDYDSGEAWGQIITVDLTTGSRTILAARGTPEGNKGCSSPRRVAINSATDRFLVACSSDDAVHAGELESGEMSILSSAALQPEMNGPRALATDPDDPKVAYVATEFNDSLLRLDLASGDRTLISNNEVESDVDFVSPDDLLIDIGRNRVLVVDEARSSGGLVAVDLSTGVRTPIETDEEIFPYSITTDDIDSRVLLSDVVRGLLAVDLATGNVTELRGTISGGEEVSVIRYVPELDYILWLDERGTSLYAFDLKTEGLVTIAKSAP